MKFAVRATACTEVLPAGEQAAGSYVNGDAGATVWFQHRKSFRRSSERKKPVYCGAFLEFRAMQSECLAFAGMTTKAVRTWLAGAYDWSTEETVAQSTLVGICRRELRVLRSM